MTGRFATFLAFSLGLLAITGILVSHIASAVEVARLPVPPLGLPRWGKVVSLWMLVYVLNTTTAYGVKGFAIQAFKLPAGSMMPALLVGDHMLVNKLWYHFHGAQPGEVAVFIYPKNREKIFVKRIVAIAGETVEIRHKQLYVNGEKANDPWAIFTQGEKEIPGPRDNFGPFTVPLQHVFVLGDNRDASHDSRFWGTVPVEDVLGKVLFLYWSWDGEENRVRWDRIGRKVSWPSLIPKFQFASSSDPPHQALIT